MKIVATQKMAFSDRFIPRIKNGMKKHTVRKSKQTVGKTIPFYDAYGVIPFDEKRITAIQDIVIDIDNGNMVTILSVKIDGNQLPYATIKEFVANDGFDSVDDFIQFFKAYGKHYEGKLIHWTDKRY